MDINTEAVKDVTMNKKHIEIDLSQHQKLLLFIKYLITFVGLVSLYKKRYHQPVKEL